ncbi:MAG TPA: phage holin family protein [Acidimicrobiales bacterium]|nr:phage holin family protein [Acidimicrobiales bacterium]
MPATGSRGRGAPRAAAPEERPLGELLSEVTSQLQALMRKEIELAKVETKAQIDRGVKGAAAFAAAGVVGLLAAILLSFAAAWGLAAVMPTGLAFLIVAVVFGAVAGVMALQGKRKLATFSPVPERTVETVKEDVQAAKDALQRGAQGPPQEQQGYSDAWRRY